VAVVGVGVERDVGDEADAEALPFPDASFDVVVSTFGVMFTPDQERAAAELLRVCRPGGKIGLASWTPDGFIGQLFKTIGGHLPPPAGVKSPALWGTRGRIVELFEAEALSIETGIRCFAFRYRSPEHWLEVFRAYYGPRRSRRWRTTSWPWPGASTAPPTARWWCAASTSKPS